jgi:hypothetical protein
MNNSCDISTYVLVYKRQIPDGETNTLATHGLEEPFSSCAVVSVFCSGGK